MDRLGAMRVFVTVADAGSLSAAARRLGMPLATVSRQLAQLEEEVGARLLTRTTRHLVLTEPGRGYIEACRRILEEVEAAERKLAGERSEPTGTLALTAPMVFGRLHVLPIVTDFLIKFPRVEVRMMLIDRSVDLVEEQLDVAVRIGKLPASTLVSTRVGAVRPILCAAPAYLKARGTPTRPEQLSQHDCISFSGAPTAERWTFGRRGARRTERVRARLAVNSAEAAVDAAIAGLGIARVLSYQAERALRDGSLKRVLADFEGDDMPVSILHRETRLPQAKVQSFVAFAAGSLRKRMQGLARGPTQQTSR
jgi:DNA-binding transcriptional LysR family regulator